MPHTGRIFTSALFAGLLILLVIVLADVQQSRAATNLLAVTTEPDGELRIGVPLSFSFTISNTTGSELTAVTLTHELSPDLSLTDLRLSNATSCAVFPCNLGTVLTDATVLVTATYSTVASELNTELPLIATATLSATELAAAEVVSNNLQIVDALSNLLVVTTDPEDALRIGAPLSFNFTVSNTTGSELSAVTLTNELSPELSLTSLALSNEVSCVAFPCNLGSVLTDASVLVTATYRTVASELVVGSPLGYTTTLSATKLESAAVVSNSLQITDSLSLLPYLRRPYPDVYIAWQRLSPPAGEGDVNYLYVAGGESCAGPTREQFLPEPIFAATDNGIYQLTAAGEVGSLPGWVQRGGVGLDVLDIISTGQVYYAGAINSGSVLVSDDAGVNWVPQPLPGGNERVYSLAAVGERVLAGGNLGLFVREPGGTWVREPAINGIVFAVAAGEQIVYAAHIGNPKDTIWLSTQGGAVGTWLPVAQLPDPANFVQVINYQLGTEPELLIGVVDAGIYQLRPAGFIPFSVKNLTTYGIWRDADGRVYSANEEPGGLLRFPAIGGTAENLSSQAGAPPITERLYTVNGRAAGACPIVGVGSREGNVWLRRPLP